MRQSRKAATYPPDCPDDSDEPPAEEVAPEEAADSADPVCEAVLAAFSSSAARCTTVAVDATVDPKSPEDDSNDEREPSICASSADTCASRPPSDEPDPKSDRATSAAAVAGWTVAALYVGWGITRCANAGSDAAYTPALKRSIAKANAERLARAGDKSSPRRVFARNTLPENFTRAPSL